jgi:hypothetical protein
MFKTAPAAEPAPTVPNGTPDLIPLSHLSLDVDEPSVGWDAYLTGRGIPVVFDDVGRRSVSRADARQLLDEQREAEARRQEVVRRQEQQFIEADQRFRAQLSPGLPWYALPDGVSPAQAWAAAEKDSQPRRQSVLEHALTNSGQLEYHPLRDEEP